MQIPSDCEKTGHDTKFIFDPIKTDKVNTHSIAWCHLGYWFDSYTGYCKTEVADHGGYVVATVGFKTRGEAREERWSQVQILPGVKLVCIWLLRYVRL